VRGEGEGPGPGAGAGHGGAAGGLQYREDLPGREWPHESRPKLKDVRTRHVKLTIFSLTYSFKVYRQ